MSCNKCLHCNKPEYVTYVISAAGLAGGTVSVGRKCRKVTKNDDFIMIRHKNEPLFIKAKKSGIKQFKIGCQKQVNQLVHITPILNNEIF
jgi:hypothetical protein